MLGTLAAEALVFRIAINSTFHPELLKTYHHLETLTALYVQSPLLQNSELQARRRSLWLGLPPEMFDLVYKISFLRRKVPLTKDQWFEAAVINQRLDALHLPEPEDAGSIVPRLQFEIELGAFYVRRLYLSAAKLVLMTIMALDATATDAHVQQLLRGALADLMSFNSITPLLMYPIAVVGTAATRAQDRELITSQLQRMRHRSGHREIDSVMRFLQAAWGEASEAYEDMGPKGAFMPRGLDIWRDESRLKSVIM